MCLPKPYPRCASHTFQKASQAAEAFDSDGSPKNHAVLSRCDAEYKMTKTGLNALRTNGAVEEANYYEGVRAELVSEAKAYEDMIASMPAASPTRKSVAEKFREVATSRDTSPATLDQLVSKEYLRMDIASNPNTSLSTLRRLATDPAIASVGLKAAVAAHPNATPDLMTTLVYQGESLNLWKDEQQSQESQESSPSLSSTSESYKAPAGSQQTTSVPSQSSVSGANVGVSVNTSAMASTSKYTGSPVERLQQAIADPKAPAELLDRVSRHPKGRKAVASHPNTSPETLRRLASEVGHDDQNSVHWNIAQNPNCPADVLEGLKYSKSADVRSMAHRVAGTKPL